MASLAIENLSWHGRRYIEPGASFLGNYHQNAVAVPPCSINARSSIDDVAPLATIHPDLDQNSLSSCAVWSQNLRPVDALAAPHQSIVLTALNQASSSVATPITCPSIDSIPPGRQSTKILKCGIAGCTSTKLFDRKWELQRHMVGHGGRNFSFTVSGCTRRGNEAFARDDKLREHMRTVHGR